MTAGPMTCMDCGGVLPTHNAWCDALRPRLDHTPAEPSAPCPVCEAAHALCLSGAPASTADFLKSAIVQERKAKEAAEAELDRLRAALDAEVAAKLALSLRMDSIAATLGFSSKDWCRNRHDAWIYAIAVGWGDQIEEVAAIHRWESFEVDRLCRMQPNNVRRAAGEKS